MAENQTYKIGDRVSLTDLADAPEGSWLIRETMQFMRAQAGHSIVSLTPIEGTNIPVTKNVDRFTLVYAGNSHVEKTFAVAEALNCL